MRVYEYHEWIVYVCLAVLNGNIKKNYLFLDVYAYKYFIQVTGIY